jgi:transporter family protein
MHIGPIFAILTAASFAVTQILVRRATYLSEESFTPLAVSMLVGTPIFVVIVTLFGEWGEFLSFTWQQYVLLITAGLIHLIIARYLFFNSTRIIGANPTVAITRTSVIFSVIMGFAFLGESITVQKIIAALLIMLGAIMTTTEITRTTFRISTKGLLMGIGTALCASGSATLIRPVMEVTDAIYAATFIMYLTAFIIIVFLLLLRQQQRSYVLQQSRHTFLILSIGAVFLVVGHLLRFSALHYSPVSVAQPIMASIVIFVLLFSWIVNRRIDVFNWRVIVGIVLVLGGVFLMSI